MRRILPLALVLAFLNAPALAETLERLRDSDTIRIGVRQDARPFSYIDGNGNAAGYSVQLCEAVVRALKREPGLEALDIEYKLVTSADQFLKLATDEVDLICGATTVTLTRMGEADFSLLTFATGADLMTLKDSGIASIPDLAGKEIGVIDGTTSEAHIHQILAASGINATVVEVPTHRDLLASLETGAIDAAFGDRALLLEARRTAVNPANILLTGNRYSYEPYAMPMKRGDVDFRQAIDRALARIYATDEIKAIYEASFGSLDNDPEVKALYRLLAIPE